jgi:hypothetical protein
VSVGIAVVLDMSFAPQMDVLLVSGRQRSGRGFRAFYQHIPCQRREGALPADCGQVADSEHFTLTDSGSMVHRSCVYRILRHSAVSASAAETAVTIHATPLNLALNASEFEPHSCCVCVYRDHHSFSGTVLVLQTCYCHACLCLYVYVSVCVCVCLCLWTKFKPPLVHILASRFCQLPKLVKVARCMVTHFKVAVIAVNIRQCCPLDRHEG